MKTASGKAQYGFDTPGVMQGLLAAGIGGGVIGGFVRGLSFGWLQVVAQKPMIIDVSLATSQERMPALG
jgi:hypothetical protein